MNREVVAKSIARIENELEVKRQLLGLCEYLTPIMRDAISRYDGPVDRVDRVEISTHGHGQHGLDSVVAKFSNKGYVND